MTAHDETNSFKSQIITKTTTIQPTETNIPNVMEIISTKYTGPESTSNENETECEEQSTTENVEEQNDCNEPNETTRTEKNNSISEIRSTTPQNTPIITNTKTTEYLQTKFAINYCSDTFG